MEPRIRAAAIVVKEGRLPLGEHQHPEENRLPVVGTE